VPAVPARASDADRAAVVAVLHDAVVRGMLTLEECDERVAAAYAARFLHELPPLTADLPAASAPVPPGWRALMQAALLQLRSSLAAPPSDGTGGLMPRLVVAVVLVVGVLAVVGIGVSALEELFDFD
jgi:hypothetical protein